MRYCSACGHGNDDAARFCFSCGQGAVTAAPSSSDMPAFAPPIPIVQSPPSGASHVGTAGLIVGVISLALVIAVLIVDSVGWGLPIIGVIAGLSLTFVGIRRNQNKTNPTITAGLVCNALAFVLVSIALLVSLLGSLSSSTTEPSAFPGNGLFIVGAEIAPGTYRSEGAVVPDGCRFRRLSSAGNTLDSQIIGYGQSSGVFVTIRESDGAFHTSGCYRWIPR